MLLQGIPNPDYMNGTNPTIERFALNSDLAEYGGMGTTGSLGVNFAAPLTRGGFPGEIFDPLPMPTGHWKDAPIPVMLGMHGDVGSNPVIPPVSTGGIGTLGMAAIAGLAAFLLLKK